MNFCQTTIAQCFSKAKKTEIRKHTFPNHQISFWNDYFYIIRAKACTTYELYESDEIRISKTVSRGLFFPWRQDISKRLNGCHIIDQARRISSKFSIYSHVIKCFIHVVYISHVFWCVSYPRLRSDLFLIGAKVEFPLALTPQFDSFYFVCLVLSLSFDRFWIEHMQAAHFRPHSAACGKIFCLVCIFFFFSSFSFVFFLNEKAWDMFFFLYKRINLNSQYSILFTQFRRTMFMSISDVCF